MEKFIPFEKLSKRKQRELTRMKRSDWGNINPITKREKNKKVYDRKKFRRDFNDENGGIAFLYSIFYRLMMKQIFCSMHV